MIYEAVYSCPAAQAADASLMNSVKKKVLHMVMMQTIKTNDFLHLYQHLQSKGVAPLVVKGIVYRSIYPQPDYRISGDEDIQSPKEKYSACHDAMTYFGMQLANP